MYSVFTSIIIYLIPNIKFTYFDVPSEIINALMVRGGGTFLRLSNTGLTEFNLFTTDLSIVKTLV